MTVPEDSPSAGPRLVDGPGPDWRALARRHGTPLLVLDCDRVRHQYRTLRQALPDVELHYAIKALPEAAMIATLAEEGCGFDIATRGEIDLLAGLGIDPRRCVHTHPIKRDADIRAALRFGCTTFVADNPDELDKLVPWRHRVAVLLRLSFPNPDARVDLSRKFGVAPDELDDLLAAADRRGLHVKGLSFHVGSQAPDPAAHRHAVETCVPYFRQRRPDSLAPLSVLDIGGGFPVNHDGAGPGIEPFCAPIRDALAALPGHVRILAEPGRYLAAPTVTCLTSVVGRARRGNRTWYYLDDGVYGSFSGLLHDGARYPLIAPDARGPARPSVLAGPTCDSIDVIAEDIELGELAVGDLLIAPMIGAYSAASASEFNSIPRTPVLALAPPAAVSGQGAALRLA